MMDPHGYGERRAQSAPGGPRDRPSDKVGHTLLGLSHIRRSPKWSFNGRHREHSGAAGPGPGTYGQQPLETTSRYLQSPRFAFGASTRDAGGDKQRVPGPGAYTAPGSVGIDGKAYSLTPRRGNRMKNLDQPGPGTHDTKTHLGNGPKYSASPRRSECAKRGQGPGPGEYDQADAATAGKQPKWGFGTSQRPETANSTHATTPGPGAYVMGHTVGGGAKYSMQSRRSGPRPHPSPGPGAHGGHYSTFG